MFTGSYIILNGKFRKEGRRWVARCDELGTSTFGRSIREADEHLKEAILCHLNTLGDVGERERFFKENNIIFHKIKPKHNIDINTSMSDDTFLRPIVQRIPTVAN